MELGLKLVIAAACFSAATACPLDERKLEGLEGPVVIGGGEAGQGDDGDSGASVGGSTAQGGSSTGGVGASTGGGGASGAQGGSSGDSGGSGNAGSSSGGAPVGRCPDLDANGELDCDETLATNATFDASVIPWMSETPNILADWNDADAHDKMGSGSLSIENRAEGASLAGVRQCLPVTGGAIYNFAVEAMVPEEAGNALAGMTINTYTEPACSGQLADPLPKQSNYIGSGTGWRVAQLNYLLPTNAQSVAIRLVCTKPSAGPPGRAFYDNVLVNVD